MNETLKAVFTPEVTTLQLGAGVSETQYVLTFPMQAIIAYKQRTAQIDRQRYALKPAVSPAQQAILRGSMNELLASAQACVPLVSSSDPGSWPAADRLKYEDLIEQAVAIKRQLDEAKGDGDSLFDTLNWRKLDPISDPERLLAALWAAVQEKSPGVTEADLAKIINPGNVAKVTLAIAQALTAYIRRSDTSVPNGSAPAAMPAPTTIPNAS